VVSDLISLARHIRDDIRTVTPPLAYARPRPDALNLQPMKDIRMAYYFRFSAKDRPGVLSKISGVLGENNISIYSVIQKGREEKGSVPLVMLTHEAKERDVLNALASLSRLHVLNDDTILIRVVQEMG
jgi:homoserine dehydrogenase